MLTIKSGDLWLQRSRAVRLMLMGSGRYMFLKIRYLRKNKFFIIVVQDLGQKIRLRVKWRINRAPKVTSTEQGHPPKKKQPKTRSQKRSHKQATKWLICCKILKLMMQIRIRNIWVIKVNQKMKMQAILSIVGFQWINLMKLVWISKNIKNLSLRQGCVGRF